MSRVMFSLPNKLVIRMKAAIPAGERSEVLAHLLENELKSREENLYKRAVKLEASAGLRQEMTEWDTELGQDGLDDL